MAKINFVVDKRTELVSVILALSECNSYVEEHFNLNIKDDYKAKVLNRFEKFKNYKCVEIARELGEKESGFNYDNLIRLGFELDEKYKFNGELSYELERELDEIKLVKEFLNEVQYFAVASNFDLFYLQNLSYYESKKLELGKVFSKDGFYSVLSEFLKGEKVDNICVNIIPSLINSNHGFKANNTIYANVGLLSENYSKIDSFDNGYRSIITHEIMHCFVNCLTEKYNIKSFDFGINEKAKKFGYNNKISYINDTIVRALTIRLMEKLFNINKDKFIKLEESFGFDKVGYVYNEILNYEKQNKSWEEYFENVINLFYNQKTK